MNKPALSSNMLSIVASLMIASLISLSGCGSKHTPVNENNARILSGASIKNEAQVELLSTKLMQADYTWMGINDAKTVQKVLIHKYKRPISKPFFQCIYENIDREGYKEESYGVAVYLAKTYNDDIDLLIYKLGELKPVIDKIFNHPQPVTFDTNNILNSSALQILKQYEAVMLTETMKNKRYRPLLAVIGLPAIGDDGVIEDLSIMQINSMMKIILAAEPRCS